MYNEAMIRYTETMKTKQGNALLKPHPASPKGRLGGVSNEGICPYFVVLYSTERITSLLVNQSTRQLSLI